MNREKLTSVEGSFSVEINMKVIGENLVVSAKGTKLATWADKPGDENN